MDDTTEALEIDLLLEAIFRKYGYDFRNYARASLVRRIRNCLNKTETNHISELIPNLLHDKNFFHEVLSEFSVPVTEMFRDPIFYQAFRLRVIPYLRTYPFIKIWHAGCATGEEVYSFAILLQEEGLYDRTIIFATDFNENALEIAKEGIYRLDNVRYYTGNYQKSGGKKAFSDYYYAGGYDSVIMDNALKKNITFANHNLASDGVFGEMHVILCRNVMIYFDKVLQNRVLNLFHQSLVRQGFLCLGTKESLHFSTVEDAFEEVETDYRIYRLK